MSLCIAGMGWVTPLGSGIDAVWERLLRGDEASPSAIAGPFERKSYSAFRVPDDALADLPAHARLRRASAISRFAVAAGLAAMTNARSTIDKIDISRTALIFAVSNGGVCYTKRFYHDILQTGANSASPLLFPETVFNAPASHLAAVLGLRDASYTLVGDGAVGILAIQMAQDLMDDEAIDYCLVVGAEEADWVLCDAYRKWRLLRPAPPIEPFRQPPRGTILSEGAGAILLGRSGPVVIDQIHSGGNFERQTKTGLLVKKIVTDLTTNAVDLIISSANGTFVDAAEEAAMCQDGGDAIVYSPKPALGEGVGASGLWQVIAGAVTTLKGEVPPLLHGPASARLRTPGAATRLRAKRVLVLDCGMNQQATALALSANN